MNSMCNKVTFFNIVTLCRSGLEQDDMRTLYKYLVTSLFPSTIDLEVSSSYAVVLVPKAGRYLMNLPGGTRCDQKVSRHLP